MTVSPLPTRYPHIDLDDDNVPFLTGTTMKVVELVMAHQADGWRPQELHFQHPYLSMSQIHAALAYYWDHKAEVDGDIDQRRRYAQQARAEAGRSPLAEKLREQGVLDQPQT